MLTGWMFSKLKKMADSRPPDFVMGHNYCNRWWVIPRNKILNVYLHQFLSSDARVMHDHPWWNVSIVLKGSYEDQTVNKKVLCQQGTIKFRNASKPHRLELKSKECWSLFITGPVIREWGLHCPKGWVSWRKLADKDGHVIHKCD